MTDRQRRLATIDGADEIVVVTDAEKLFPKKGTLPERVKRGFLDYNQYVDFVRNGKKICFMLTA